MEAGGSQRARADSQDKSGKLTERHNIGRSPPTTPYPRLARKLERDVRTRADAAVKGIEAGGALVIGAVERQLAKASTVVLKQFAAASRTEIEALTRRVAVLEKRLASLERRRRKPRRTNA